MTRSNRPAGYPDLAEAALDDDDVARAATYGLTFVAEKRGLAWGLSDDDRRAMARAALGHALSTTKVVPRSYMDEALEKAERTSDQRLRRACAAEVARDRTLVAVQRLLHDLAADHPELAKHMEAAADEIGVVWYDGGIPD